MRAWATAIVEGEDVTLCFPDTARVLRGDNKEGSLFCWRALD